MSLPTSLDSTSERTAAPGLRTPFKTLLNTLAGVPHSESNQPPNRPDSTTTPPAKDFLCAIESYATQTVVTLTETPTIGQFDKWAKDCKGQPAPTCTLTLDPNAPNPGKTARALFKP